MRELDKSYNPLAVEDKIYECWLSGGYFRGESDPEKEPFTIVIPPPNVTGQLHMGHALNNILQDVLIRFKRMRGYAALWIPGSDHAGIATQIKVEEMLRNERGVTRYDLGREKFLEIVWDWKRKYGGRIIEQLKKLGCSCDWERERFTMDEGCSKAVREVFVSLYEKGLIYRGRRIINWCPDCATALSDAEVEYSEKDGNLWHIKYPLSHGSGFLTVATTRPETMLGDMAVAVHPDDERYKALVGKMLRLPLADREIPIIADEYVEMEFGTGCVKITPSHDPNDFEVAARHNLPQLVVIDDKAKINENGGTYQGLDRYAARKKIVADLEAQGLLEKVDSHVHNVGTCYRCKTTVEPVASRQWFVSMKPLAAEAIEVVKDGRVRFVPDRFSKIYMNWMENVRDWCISRQLWWGHRIPAFYCDACGETIVSREDIKTCPKCGGKLRQEEDVLDTWFSSALWPFSTLGWPDKSADLDFFYPTSVLVTAYDIIFFWVARMIFSGMEHMKKEPFHTVFVHGLVRDEQGRKMSKSLGNGIDPLELVENYGADALRFTLNTGISPGNDTRLVHSKVEASRNFANKIWNASRFALMNLKITDAALPDKPYPEDKWILSKFNSLVPEVTENIDRYELGLAAQKLYEFFWESLCDWYIELIKPRLLGEGEASESAQRVLCHVLTGTLKLLHPFMPFITEEIYQALPGNAGSIMVARWPERDDKLNFPEDERNMDAVMELIRAVRNRRAEMNVPPSRKASLLVVTENPEIYIQSRAFIEKLASASGVETSPAAPEDTSGMVAVVAGGVTCYLPLAELVDMEKERARLKAEREKTIIDIERVNAKLANDAFVSRAPEAVVNVERDKLAALLEKLKKLEDAQVLA